MFLETTIKSKVKDLHRVKALSEDLGGISAQDGLLLMSKMYPGAVKFSSAFGQEDQVITDMIWGNSVPLEIFTLDTGRLFPETYELIDKTRSKYKLEIKTYFPNTEAVQKLASTKGMNSFYDSVANRKECCFVRKIEPLKRALQGAKVWVTGLRADQSKNRQDFNLVEWDESNQVIKYNPLLFWTYSEMVSYIEKYQVPYNTLHDKGFVSIGCAPCTRAIKTHEHPRDGRWWWETSKKECGLHQ